MILDVAALQNLAVLEVNDKSLDSIKGSLIRYLDKTSTPFGKRLMKIWVCYPLLNRELINERLDAITELHKKKLLSKTGEIISDLPDLERLSMKFYIYTKKSISKNTCMKLLEEFNIYLIL